MTVPAAPASALDRLSDVYLTASRAIVLAIPIGMFAVMVAVNALEIAGRAVFGISFSWVQEISILAAMWVYFFAYAMIVKNDEYIRVDLFTRYLPAGFNCSLDIFARLLVIAFHAVMIWFGVETFRFLSLFTTSVLDWPESLFVLPVVAGSVDILLTELIRIRRILLRRPAPPAPPQHADMETL